MLDGGGAGSRASGSRVTGASGGALADLAGSHRGQSGVGWIRRSSSMAAAMAALERERRRLGEEQGKEKEGEGRGCAGLGRWRRLAPVGARRRGQGPEVGRRDRAPEARRRGATPAWRTALSDGPCGPAPVRRAAMVGGAVEATWQAAVDCRGAGGGEPEVGGG